MTEFRSSRNVLFPCKYRVVFYPKCRRPMPEPPIDERLKELIQQVCDEMQSGPIEMEVMPDHVHLLLDCDPQFGIYRLVRGAGAAPKDEGSLVRTMRCDCGNVMGRDGNAAMNIYNVVPAGSGQRPGLGQATRVEIGDQRNARKCHPVPVVETRMLEFVA